MKYMNRSATMYFYEFYDVTSCKHPKILHFPKHFVLIALKLKIQLKCDKCSYKKSFFLKKWMVFSFKMREFVIKSSCCSFWACCDVNIITDLVCKSQTKTCNDSTNKKHAQILSWCFEDDTNDEKKSCEKQGWFSAIVSSEVACKQGGHSSCKRNRSNICL